MWVATVKWNLCFYRVPLCDLRDRELKASTVGSQYQYIDSFLMLFDGNRCGSISVTSRCGFPLCFLRPMSPIPVTCWAPRCKGGKQGTATLRFPVSLVQGGDLMEFGESLHDSDGEDVLLPMLGMKQLNPMIAGSCSNFSELLCPCTFCNILVKDSNLKEMSDKNALGEYVPVFCRCITLKKKMCLLQPDEKYWLRFVEKTREVATVDDFPSYTMRFLFMCRLLQRENEAKTLAEEEEEAVLRACCKHHLLIDHQPILKLPFDHPLTTTIWQLHIPTFPAGSNCRPDVDTYKFSNQLRWFEIHMWHQMA